MIEWKGPHKVSVVLQVWFLTSLLCVCMCVYDAHWRTRIISLCAPAPERTQWCTPPLCAVLSAVSWSYSSSHTLPSALWWKYGPSHRLLNARKTTERFLDIWISAKIRSRLTELCSRSPKCYAQKRHKWLPYKIYSSCIFSEFNFSVLALCCNLNNQSTLEAFSWLLAWLNNSRTKLSLMNPVNIPLEQTFTFRFSPLFIIKNNKLAIFASLWSFFWSENFCTHKTTFFKKHWHFYYLSLFTVVSALNVSDKQECVGDLLWLLHQI